MKSLDEQIEYMRREEVDFYSKTFYSNRPRSMEDMEMCQAILDTLLQLKCEASRKVGAVIDKHSVSVTE